MCLGEVAADDPRLAVVGEVRKNLLLPPVILGEGEGHQLVEVQAAVAVHLQQLGADSAEPQALAHHMRRHAEAGGDLLRSPPAIFRKLAERLELVGRMHRLAGDVLVKADLVRVIRRVDDAAHRLGLPDLLALHAEKLGKPAAFAHRHEIAVGGLSRCIKLGLHHKVLQHTLDGDAGGQRLDGRFAVRGLAGIARRLLQLVERNEIRRAARGLRLRCGQRADDFFRRFPNATDFRIRNLIRHRLGDGPCLLRCSGHCSDPFSVNAEGMSSDMPSGGA